MVFYRRNLPHILIPGSIFFVNTRLAGSLPINKMEVLRKEYELEQQKLKTLKHEQNKRSSKKEIQRNIFLKYDELLHTNKSGPHWLGDDRIAQIVADSLHWGANVRYKLFAFSIMPNHIHLALKPILTGQPIKKYSNPEKKKDYFLTDIMESFKKFTAGKANKVLGRSGAFWQHESYDHFVRNEKELYRVIHYTLWNPVKAGLARTPEEYKWNYVNDDLT